MTDNWRWTHFKPSEIACRHCQQLPEPLDVDILDRLELLRSTVDKPLHVNSGYRCRAHNLIVGGAAYSQHKSLAFDLALGDHQLDHLYTSALDVGFLGIGLGSTFIHLDMRRPVDGRVIPHRFTLWHYGTESKNKWRSILSEQLSAQSLARWEHSVASG